MTRSFRHDLAPLARLAPALAALAGAACMALAAAPSEAAAATAHATSTPSTPTTAHATPASAAPRDSLHRLDAPLVDHRGHAFMLADHRGRPFVVSLFYTSCQFTCPMLVEALRANEQRLTDAERRGLDVLLVSLDPARDDLATLRRTAAERHVDTPRWQLARTDAAHVRQLAATLDIPYRQRDDGDFNHATTLVLVDAEGRIAARTNELSGADPAFVAKVRQALAATR